MTDPYGCEIAYGSLDFIKDAFYTFFNSVLHRVLGWFSKEWKNKKILWRPGYKRDFVKKRMFLMGIKKKKVK